MLELIKHFFSCKYTKTISTGRITRISDESTVGSYYIKECEVCGKIRRFNCYYSD